jgi:hypothetical protein
MLKLAILVILIVPSIMASISEQIASALIAEKDTGKLEQTFQDLRKKHGNVSSPWALADVAERGHPEIVVTCLGTEQDPFPNDNMCESYLVNNTLSNISFDTPGNSESFARVITSLKPTDVKPLASIRDFTPRRSDAVKVLKRVMDQVPELITDTLPNWLASHTFDRGSWCYTTAREEVYQYLASFATESVLEKALSIVNKNEHYKVDFSSGPTVMCCGSQDNFPQDLIDKLSTILALVKTRNELVKAALSFMPTVLLKLLTEYITYETA